MKIIFQTIKDDKQMAAELEQTTSPRGNASTAPTSEGIPDLSDYYSIEDQEDDVNVPAVQSAKFNEETKSPNLKCIVIAKK